MRYYAQYSAAAYCKSDDGVGARTTCKDVCPDVMANGASVVGSFPGTTSSDMRGFVAVDTVRREIVVVFRGSDSLRNWLADLAFIHAPCDYTEGCYVHTGFKTAWGEVSAYCFDYVTQALASNPDYTLVVTGHCLGGAVATLAAVELRKMGHACDLYTYGSPRVGNLAFVDFVTAQAGGAEYSVTHYDDPVPRVPPIWFFGYYHTSPEFWLATGPATKVDYTMGDVTTCLGSANTDCNGGTGGLDVDAHFHYFQHMGRCDDSSTGPTAITLLQTSNSITDAELELRLNNYTAQDVAYSNALAAGGKSPEI